MHIQTLNSSQLPDSNTMHCHAEHTLPDTNHYPDLIKLCLIFLRNFLMKINPQFRWKTGQQHSMRRS